MEPTNRRDYFGEKLFLKIAKDPAFSNYTNYFSKIVGIFLDLEDSVIIKMLIDDKYFNTQVKETINFLSDIHK